MLKRRPSLQLRLILWLTATVMLAAIAASITSFFVVYHEAREMQDELLEQTAQFAATAGQPDNGHIDDDVRIHLQTVDQPRKNDIPLPKGLANGFHNITHKKEDYRVYIYEDAHGQRMALLQENDFYQDSAYTSASLVIWPILLLIPILALLSFLAVHLSLKPIKSLSENLSHRSENDLSPLSENNIPIEIKGFISAINRLFDKIKEGIVRQQRFIADAAHELRSPMTALSLQAERLSQRDLPPETAAQLDSLREGIRRNRHLLEQLLTIARAQQENKTVSSQTLSARHICECVVQDLYPLAEAKSIDFGIDGEADAMLIGNETEFYTLLKTLADNAINYTGEGGRVDLRVKSLQNACLLEVEDNGPGIPIAERERVFDSFYRILGTGTEGSGLGLAIAKTLTERYGGSISLHASPTHESGLLVQVRLPVAPH
ncbi:MAG: ATP-binding protein [Neisseria sp.]|uniref:sensor histidine kinase n=1 Tax=Neisseria sp. TaxID=192066 RepID=UPI0026DD104E|nr:ATP-binding protein [Neisseria sp.]MDO4641221.1 ATP-binding protein [Neisseria sp.]